VGMAGEEFSRHDRQHIVDQLSAIAGAEWVSVDSERIVDYLTDETGPPVTPEPSPAQILVKPANAGQLASVLRLANESGTPVFPRGGGTGLCGGAVPTAPGIILSLERLRSFTIDRDNLMATAGAGVTLRELIERVEAAGLFFPPHPGDESAQVGGLVACNAGGARAVKYGVMRSYVKGMEVVLASGDVLRLGGHLIKNNTGFDLMHLIIGSEGALGVITEVTLRLYSPPHSSCTMIIPFDDRHAAINAVPEILRSGITPLAIEYMERDLVEMSAEQLGLEWPCKTGTAYLMFIVDGESDSNIHSQCTLIHDISRRHSCLEPLIGQSRREQDRILRIRSNIYTSLKRDLADALDVAVPPASMGDLMDSIDRIAERFGTRIPTCGHAGDGNLHPTLMKDLLDGGGQRLKEAKRAIYEEALRLGGTMTGEHGVGKIRTTELDIFLGPVQRGLTQAIKKVFDPRGILNPGCAVPPE